MKTHILNLFAYNHWANERLVEATPENLLDQNAPSSFPSLRETWYHAWDAEVAWFDRMQGNPPQWPICAALGLDWTGVAEYMQQHRKSMMAWLTIQPDAWFERSLTYKNLKGQEFSGLHVEVLTHLINHGSFHRGQIVTQLRQLGVNSLPSTDMIAFYREKNG